MAQWHGEDAPAGSVPENYQRYFVPAIGAPAAADLIATAALQPGERVLDVACGTGVVARLAAHAVGPTGIVAGLDLNPGMLAVARATTPPPLTIDWHEASAEQMPLADAVFDVVLCQMGLQFVPDKPKALREMHRVLVPDGRLVLNVPGPTPEVFGILDDALARHVGPEAAGFVRQVFSLHDTAEIGDMIADAGFRDVQVEADHPLLTLPPPADFLWQYVHSTPLAPAVVRLDDARREQLEHDVVTAWRPYLDEGALLVQTRMVSATARK